MLSHNSILTSATVRPSIINRGLVSPLSPLMNPIEVYIGDISGVQAVYDSEEDSCLLDAEWIQRNIPAFKKHLKKCRITTYHFELIHASEDVNCAEETISRILNVDSSPHIVPQRRTHEDDIQFANKRR